MWYAVVTAQSDQCLSFVEELLRHLSDLAVDLYNIADVHADLSVRQARTSSCCFFFTSHAFRREQ